MSEAAPGYRDSATFATTERARLADATRHLIDAVLTTEDLASETLLDAASAVERVVEAITGVPVGDHPLGSRRRDETARFDHLPRSPVVGDASPLAPPFEWEVRDGRTHASATLGAPYEGPPGYVHGGMIALIFDEILGMANVVAGTPGMTGTLTVRYRRPTPLHRRVDLEGWVDRQHGRRLLTRGTMSVDGSVTAEAEGIFVSITPERAAEYFGREPDR